jgi:hypothetical protein
MASKEAYIHRRMALPHFVITFFQTLYQSSFDQTYLGNHEFQSRAYNAREESTVPSAPLPKHCLSPKWA